MASAEPRGLSKLHQVLFPAEEEKEGGVEVREAATAFCRAGKQLLAPASQKEQRALRPLLSVPPAQCPGEGAGNSAEHCCCHSTDLDGSSR